MKIPNYLKGYEKQWEENPHKASLAWFSEANYGLFLHYGLYTQLGRHEWVMKRRKIPIAEYEKLADTFDPSKFDADMITDLACEAEMKYVNLTTCHHEGFCLWNSEAEPFNAFKFSRRDLVRELAEACDKKGLGFFAYYTNLLNWRHPYALTREYFEHARPDYPNGDPRYVLTHIDEWGTYWDYVKACIKELCSMDYPVAGIWLDLILGYYLLADHVPIEEVYDVIRQTRPGALISFKQGATGTEDFAAPEFHTRGMANNLRKNGKVKAADVADKAWAANKDKHNEICWTLQDGTWAYNPNEPWKDADTLWKTLGYARQNRCNLLANIGPKPDGSLPEEGVKVIREVGRRIRAEGFPEGEAVPAPAGSGGAEAE